MQQHNLSALLQPRGADNPVSTDVNMGGLKRWTAQNQNADNQNLTSNITLP